MRSTGFSEAREAQRRCVCGSGCGGAQVDAFCERLEPRGVASHSRKKYSDPSFFVDEWMKKETFRQQKALEARAERRRGRLELKHDQSRSLSLRQQQHPPNQQTPRESEASTTNNATGSECEGRTSGVNKYLKIRSWREIYGTGEGKELAKHQQHQHQYHQQQQKEAAAVSAGGGGGVLSALGVKKKSSRKAMTAETPADATPEDSVDRPEPIASPVSSAPMCDSDGRSVAARVDHDVQHQPQHSTPDFAIVYPPPPPPPPTASPSAACSGAFMQEIEGDDDEIFSEFDGDLEVGGSTDRVQEEFIDHGLSYYHDPAASLAAPPPPPPPPPPPHTDGDSDEEYELALSEVPMEGDGAAAEDWNTYAPPPPPPMRLPTSTAHAADDEVFLQIAARQQSRNCLLREIQLGASLRHVRIPEEESVGDAAEDAAHEQPEAVEKQPTTALTLLEQIKMVRGSRLAV